MFVNEILNFSNIYDLEKYFSNFIDFSEKGVF